MTVASQLWEHSLVLPLWLLLRIAVVDQIANIRWIVEKAREFQKNIYFCFLDYAKAFDCADLLDLLDLLELDTEQQTGSK